MKKKHQKNRGFLRGNEKRLSPFKAPLRTGFTLIEVLVTMGVLLLVMGAAAGAGVGRKTQFNLTVNQEKVRSLISRAKGLSLNSLIREGSDICGYGVHITYDKALIFTDRSGDCENGSDHKYSGSGEDYQGGANQINLDQGIYFSDSSFAKNPGFSADILFLPPDPTTYINGVKGVDREQIIGVAFSSNFSRKVTVRGSGLISVGSN